MPRSVYVRIQVQSREYTRSEILLPVGKVYIENQVSCTHVRCLARYCSMLAVQLRAPILLNYACSIAVVKSERSLHVEGGWSTYALFTLVYSIWLILRSLRCFPPLLVGMHYGRSPWILCFLKLSFVRCTASQLRAGRDSVSARLTNVEGVQVSCNSGFFPYGSARSINKSGFLVLAPTSSVTAPLESTCFGQVHHIQHLVIPSFCHRRAHLSKPQARSITSLPSECLRD